MFSETLNFLWRVTISFYSIQLAAYFSNFLQQARNSRKLYSEPPFQSIPTASIDLIIFDSRVICCFLLSVPGLNFKNFIYTENEFAEIGCAG